MIVNCPFCLATFTEPLLSPVVSLQPATVAPFQEPQYLTLVEPLDLSSAGRRWNLVLAIWYSVYSKVYSCSAHRLKLNGLRLSSLSGAGFSSFTLGAVVCRCVCKVGMGVVAITVNPSWRKQNAVCSITNWVWGRAHPGQEEFFILMGWQEEPGGNGVPDSLGQVDSLWGNLCLPLLSASGKKGKGFENLISQHHL